MQSPGVAMLQGRMPATMASHSLTIERYGGGTSVPLVAGGTVAPGELLRATATGIGSLIDPTVDFRLIDADGKVLLSMKKAPAIGSRQVVFQFSAPSIEGGYALEAWLHTYPLLFFTHVASSTFTVAAGTPPPEAPPEKDGGFLGGFNLGDLKPLAWIVLGIVAIVAFSPVVKRLGSER